jgi:hypothetical protein
MPSESTLSTKYTALYPEDGSLRMYWHENLRPYKKEFIQ